MKSMFDPVSNEWRMSWPGRVSRHDLVYAGPPDDPTRGIPLGNGEVGVLAWCDESRIIMAINRSDLLDDPAELESLRNWTHEQEELSPTQRHAGRLIIDFALPVFDPFYLSDFEARLSLADATLLLDAAGPLGKVSIRAFVGDHDGVLRASIDADLCEPATVQVEVQRFGSRTFGHWYSQVRRDPESGLSGTEAHAGNGLAAVTQRLSTGVFCLGCRVGVGKPAATSADAPESIRRHSHEAAILVPCRSSVSFELCAAVTSPVGDPSSGDSVDRALALAGDVISDARQKGFETALDIHSESWKEFWLRSFMESGNDYLDNLWHLTMYYAAASQRGKYPGRFIFGQWGWNRDVQHWTFYFHWNQQQVYWPLNAAGHHDLLVSYLEYRFAGLPYAKDDAQHRLHAAGAVVSDVADWHGRNSEGELDNHTPVAQIALDFWRQYRYTGDEGFLRDRALPYLLEAAAFFETLFEKGDDDRFHARRGTGYEGWIRMRDAITELSCGRALFSATLEALAVTRVDDPRASRWKEILDNMAPLPTVRPEDCFETREDQTVLARGTFKGRPSFGDRTLAAGWGIEEKRLLSAKVPVDISVGEEPDPYTVLHRLEKNETLSTAIREDMKVFDGIFPFVEYSAVFPTGVIGLTDRGTELFRIASDTALLYAPDCMGWDPLPIVLARLGLADELEKIISSWPSRWQYHCNGFGHYGPRDIQKAEASLRFRTNLVRDADDPHPDSRFPFSMWPFRHMGMESMSVLASAINESMLQSHDGIIRVGPAVSTSRESARFTLHAIGGFVVSSSIANGTPLWIAVDSRQGGSCRVENPWERAIVQRNGHVEVLTGDRVIVTATESGDRLLIAPDRESIESWEVVEEQVEQNSSYKSCPVGWAELGLPRMF